MLYLFWLPVWVAQAYWLFALLPCRVQTKEQTKSTVSLSLRRAVWANRMSVETECAQGTVRGTPLFARRLRHWKRMVGNINGAGSCEHCTWWEEVADHSAPNPIGRNGRVFTAEGPAKDECNGGLPFLMLSIIFARKQCRNLPLLSRPLTQWLEPKVYLTKVQNNVSEKRRVDIDMADMEGGYSSWFLLILKRFGQHERQIFEAHLRWRSHAREVHRERKKEW